MAGLPSNKLGQTPDKSKIRKGHKPKLRHHKATNRGYPAEFREKAVRLVTERGYTFSSLPSIIFVSFVHSLCTVPLWRKNR